MKTVLPGETLVTYSLPCVEPIRSPDSLIPIQACGFHSHNLLKM